MFFVNWFKNVTKKDDEIIIKRVEFETLLNRLKNLEDMMDNISIQQTEPPIPPPLPSPPNSKQSEHIYKSKNTEIVEDDDETIKIEHVQREHYVVPFQNELESRLKMIRKRMGSSHGWDDINEMTLDNVDDLDKLERSVMEKSIIIGRCNKNNILAIGNISIYDDYSHTESINKCKNVY